MSGGRKDPRRASIPRYITVCATVKLSVRCVERLRVENCGKMLFIRSREVNEIARNLVRVSRITYAVSPAPASRVEKSSYVKIQQPMHHRPVISRHTLSPNSSTNQKPILNPLLLALTKLLNEITLSLIST